MLLLFVVNIVIVFIVIIVIVIFAFFNIYTFIEGSLEVKLPTIWTDEKQSREEAERRERVEEKE